MGHQFTVFVAHYGVIALLLLTLVKGVGVPIPVPIDLVILAAATGSASGRLIWWQAFAAVLLGMVAGGLLQYFLVRGPARNLLYRFGSRIGLTPQRLDLAFRRLENVGILGVAIAVITPAIRTAAIPASGIVRIPVKTFASGLAVGSAVYIAFQFFVAYGIVRFALGVWSHQDKAWLWLLLVPVAGAAAWMVYRHRTRHLAGLQGSIAEEDRRLGAYLCPLCRLTVVADRLSRPDRHTRGQPTRATAVCARDGG